MSLRSMALLITTQEGRVENTRSKKGLSHQKEHHIEDTLDLATEELTSLLMPEPTAAHILAMDNLLIEE
jgi:hypothetical protein